MALIQRLPVTSPLIKATNSPRFSCEQNTYSARLSPPPLSGRCHVECQVRLGFKHVNKAKPGYSSLSVGLGHQLYFPSNHLSSTLFSNNIVSVCTEKRCSEKISAEDFVNQNLNHEHGTVSAVSTGSFTAPFGPLSFQGLAAITKCSETFSAKSTFGKSNLSIDNFHESSRISAVSSNSITTSPSEPLASQGSATVTRRLILLRHAKSSWADASLKDHDRPLSKRGVQAAGNIAKKMKAIGWIPNLILCSDSLRTRQTLEWMGEAVEDFRDVEVRFLGSYYSIAAMDGQTAEHLRDTVLKFTDSVSTKTVMCMGHNRGWEEAASVLSGKNVELKTANAALLESRRPHSDWSQAWKDGWRLMTIVKPDPGLV